MKRFFGSVTLLFCSLMGMGQRVVVRVDANTVYQTIGNFGASDAWSCQFIGNWPGAKKNVIADWLFSMDTLQDGRPKGIGLSLWRTNIGAGSAEQGDTSGIRDVWRRAGDMCGSAVQGQRWFLKAAHQRGVRQFLGFLNSPPVWLTKNGKAYSSVAGVSNIDARRYEDLATYIVRVTRHIRETTGVGLSYISPVNEPQWDWSDGAQEGCPYKNEEISGLVRTLSNTLKAERLDVKIVMPESGHLKYVLADGDKPGRGDQVHAFFDPSSPNYLGGLYNVEKVVAAHSYFSTSPLAVGIDMRKTLSIYIDSLRAAHRDVRDLRYWESEYCILGDNAGEINGSRRDTGIDAALYVARVIHTDLVYGQASAWQWWLAISPYNYKDGLIYTDKKKEDGDFYDSKKLWALGNFSRWVRPGMQRIGVTGGDSSLWVSAYKGGGRTIVVVVNLSPSEREIDMKGNITMYTTSRTESLQKHVVRKGGRIIVPARSIDTLVME